MRGPGLDLPAAPRPRRPPPPHRRPMRRGRCRPLHPPPLPRGSRSPNPLSGTVFPVRSRLPRKPLRPESRILHRRARPDPLCLCGPPAMPRNVDHPRPHSTRGTIRPRTGAPGPRAAGFCVVVGRRLPVAGLAGAVWHAISKPTAADRHSIAHRTRTARAFTASSTKPMSRTAGPPPGRTPDHAKPVETRASAVVRPARARFGVLRPTARPRTISSPAPGGFRARCATPGNSPYTRSGSGPTRESGNFAAGGGCGGAASAGARPRA